MSFNNFTVGTVAGSKAQLTLSLADGPSVKTTIGEFITIPGEVAALSTELTGAASVMEGGALTLNVTAKDAYGNLVGEDTSVDIQINGDALLDDYEAGTRSGLVTATITGGMEPGDYEAVVKSGSVTEVVPFTVHPYTLTFEDPTDRMLPGTSATLTMKVVDHKGQAAPAGLPLQVFAEGLLIDQTSAVTDATGTVELVVVAGYAPGTASLKAAIGRAEGSSHSLHVGAIVGSSPVTVDNRVLLGDQTDSTPVAYERYDGQLLDLPAQASLQAKVDSADAVTLTLGTPSQPNVEPLIAYHLSGLDASEAALDAVGLHHATIEGTGTLSFRSFYRGRPGESVSFTGETYLSSAISTQLLSSAALAMRADVSLDGAQVGEVLALGEGLFTLQTQADGSLQLQYQADGQTHTLSTSQLGQSWHSVAAVFKDGEMALYLDDNLQASQTHTALDIPPPVVDADTQAVTYEQLTLTVGKGIAATLDNVELYNPAAEPLLTFADGSTAMSVAGGSAKSLNIVSTGKLNSAQTGAALPSRSVILASSAGTTSYINLMSQAAYRDFAGFYATSVYAAGHDMPALVTAAIDGQHNTLAKVSDFLVSPAHAGWFGWSVDGFLDGVSAIASLALPINEIKAIWEQLGYLATDPAKFDGVELIVNTLSLATYLPVLRPLQPVVKPIKVMFGKVKAFGNPQFITSVAGVLGDAVEYLVKRRDSAKIQLLVPFLQIAVELAKDPEAFETMVKGISSADDFWVWIEYFNLPDGGWDGDDPGPLELAQNFPTGHSPEESYAFLVKDAHAAGVGKAISTLIDGINRTSRRAGIGPVGTTLGMRSVLALKNDGLDVLKRVATSKELLAASAGLSARQLTRKWKNFLTGKTSARLHPLVFLGVVAYLETQTQEGGNLTRDGIADSIDKLYARALVDISTVRLAEEQSQEEVWSNNTAITDFATVINGGAHGALFHLAMVAYYSLLDQTPVYAIDKYRRVFYFKDSKGRSDYYLYWPSLPPDLITKKYFRVVDIILSEDNVDLATENPLAEEWIELKSLQRRANSNYQTASDGFKPYGYGPQYGYKKLGYHRQFVRDWTALSYSGNETGAWTTKKDGLDKKVNYPINISDFQWWFQHFDVTYKRTNTTVRELSPQLGTSTQEGTIKSLLPTIPKKANKGVWNSEDAIKANLMLPSSTTYRTDMSKADLSQKIKLAKIKDLVLTPLVNQNFFDQDVITELQNAGIL